MRLFILLGAIFLVFNCVYLSVNATAILKDDEEDSLHKWEGITIFYSVLLGILTFIIPFARAILSEFKKIHGSM